MKSWVAISFGTVIALLLSLCPACQPHTSPDILFETHCGSCHALPKIEDLPKSLWQAEILPQMGARLGIRDTGYNLFEGMNFPEMTAVNESGVYPFQPQINPRDWEALKAYILDKAPEKLTGPQLPPITDTMSQFVLEPISLDKRPGGLITYLGWDTTKKQMVTGDLNGLVMNHNIETGETVYAGRFGRSVTGYNRWKDSLFITSMGNINPSQNKSGRVFVQSPDTIAGQPEKLHRPVFTLVEDLNEDGKPEYLICEYGHLTGQLLLKKPTDTGTYQSDILLSSPGSIQAIARDMNGDQRLDIVVLKGQGNEGVFIFYQKDDLQFEADQVLRFSPVYGTSWMALEDFNGDGLLDIFTVHGDNADASFVPKPYHGLRIHLNQGSGQFEEAFFYPVNGATRVLVRDFDQDGDLDIAVAASFPDYDNRPGHSFVYLETKAQADFDFKPQVLPDPSRGRWFLMDAGDVDGDGDEDLMVSSFSFVFTPVPDSLVKKWRTDPTDVYVFRNTQL